MAHHEISDGKLEIEQGDLYWKLELSAEQSKGDRPTLLFIHAAVTDHTLWDAQVPYFLDQGWNCLRYDLFGYGKSLPSEAYLQSPTPRKPVDHVSLIDKLVDAALPANAKVIPIGLSIGGGLALSYTVYFPHRVAALAIVAGGVRGIDLPNTAEEDRLFEEADELLEAGDVQRAAEMQVRIWGDGPLQRKGRMETYLRQRMLAWCVDIAALEVAKRGGSTVDAVRREPAPGTQLHTIGVPVAVAYGTLDETATTETMKYIGSQVEGARVGMFETAHMVNLEKPCEFNEWLNGWLQLRS